MSQGLGWVRIGGIIFASGDGGDDGGD